MKDEKIIEKGMKNFVNLLHKHEDEKGHPSYIEINEMWKKSFKEAIRLAKKSVSDDIDRVFIALKLRLSMYEGVKKLDLESVLKAVEEAEEELKKKHLGSEKEKIPQGADQHLEVSDDIMDSKKSPPSEKPKTFYKCACGHDLHLKGGCQFCKCDRYVKE